MMETWLTAAVLVAVAAWVAAAAADAWSRVRWRRRRLALDVERYSALANLLARRDEAIVRNLARTWSGYRNFRVISRVDEAEDIVSFYLRPHDGRAVPEFLPGQFLTFRLHHEAGGEPTVRCYSLSRAHARDRDYRITIKRLAAPEGAAPGTPGGKASSWFHHRIAEGSVVEVAPPAGRFTLDLAGGRAVVFIAAGIGITPFLPMVEQLAEREPDREAWLFHGARNRKQQMGADLLQCCAENPRFHFISCYSRPAEPDLLPEGSGDRERGWVTPDLLRRRLPSSNYEFYVCGPPPMMTAVTQGLRDWGVPPGSIHTEAFSSGTVREMGRASLNAGQTAACDVSFRGSGKKLRWQANSGTLLDLAERNAVFLPSGCRAGNCGTCATPVLSGNFTYLSRPDARVDEGNCLVCISVPAGDMELA